MEEWQRGIALERLRDFAAVFKDAHKPLVFGAFGLTKERDVADYLAKDHALWTGNPPEAVALFAPLKVASEHQDFTQRAVPIPAGSVVVRAFAARQPEAGAKVLSALAERAGSRAVWLELFEEDRIAKAAAERAGFAYVTTKIMAGSEVKGIYVRGAAPPLAPLNAAEQATLMVCDREFLSADELTAIRAEVAKFESMWAQHYSTYNKRQSWTAFALRGFDDDAGFVIKPAEMSRAWKEENAARMSDRPRMTQVAEHFPVTLAACARIAPAEQCDRIRFMRLRAKDGELARHADIVEREAGTADGMLCRMHIPIITSEAARFSGWNARGERIDMAMPEGALCYLDQRKPHACKNSDPTFDRVHLVLDAHADAALRRHLAPEPLRARPIAGEEMTSVRISAKCARLQFITCGPECIAAGCGGNCCDAPSRPSGCLISIHPDEQAAIEARGGVVREGLLQPAPGARGCPFKRAGLCMLHETPDKPFGCIASPFTLNRGGTLIVRNRYKMLPCYRLAGSKQPAYRAFAASLRLLFGEAETARIAAHFDSGGGDLVAVLPQRFADMLRANDETKKSAIGQAA